MKKNQCASMFLHAVLVLFLSGNALANNDDSPSMAAYQARLEVLANSVDPGRLFDATVNLIPTQQSYETLKHRLTTIPDQHDILNISMIDSILLTLLQAFETHGSKADIDFLIDLQRFLELSRVDEAVRIKMENLIKTLSSIGSPRTLLSIEGIFPSPKRVVGKLSLPAPTYSVTPEQHSASLEEVERFYQALKKNVIGQDDILDSLRSLFIHDLIHGGARTKPELFYLMGLPGNGKDTVAEAYVDALWNTKDAHRKHMFRMTVRTREEAWTYFGSAKGFIGSDELPDLLKFLVEHSGGKYRLGEVHNHRGEVKYVVEQTPNWKQGDFLLHPSPHKAVIFVNEAHDIPRIVKNDILKQAIERGIFPITNPGNTPHSVREIQLPVTFIFASNDGIDLIEPREKNGARMGQPLSYDRLLENYTRVYRDKGLLKQTILRANGEKNNPSFPDQPGTSEEFLNRFPDHRVHILRPLSPESLREISAILVKAESEKLKSAKGRLGRYTLSLSEEMTRFITEYDAIPSENSRPLEARLKSFVFEQIYKSIDNSQIKASQQVQHIHVDLQINQDGSRSVLFKISPESGSPYEFSHLLEHTLKDVPKPPLSQERVQEILAMRQQILSNVFGVEHIVDRLIESAIVSESESRNSGTSGRPATVMAFLGKTSTGKTETAKQYVKARYGDSERMEIIDFNGIRDLDAMKAKILGRFDERNNPIASDFMKAYDRASEGNIAFIFDEAANSPKELLKALYEILREPIATGFSDGKPRPMKNVTIILTGNAGEQIYKLLPTNLPSDIYERATHEVFRIFINNPDLQRRILEETFPDALLARLGSNVYHFGPLTVSGKRQVAQLKLLKGIANLKPKASESGWNIVFGRESDVLDLFDLIEREGFNSKDQGASIDAFVRLSIIDKIKARLLSENVPSGQQIMLEVVKDPIVKVDRDISNIYRQMKLTTPSGKEYTVDIPMSAKLKSVKMSDADRILTAYHEVGHEIVSEVYFGDRVRPKYVSIIEGVTLIGSSFVHYAGIRSGQHLTHSQRTKQVVLREAAVLFAGYVAQQIVTIGARHDAGKQNDLHRATQLIQNAILRDGLSDEWGKRSVRDGVKTEDYIDKELSHEEKEKLNAITDRWMGYAEQLAREAIYINVDRLFVEFGKALSEQGFLNEKQILEIYERFPAVSERSENFVQKVDEIRAAMKLVDESYKRSGELLRAKYHAKAYSVESAEKAYNYLVLNGQGFSKFFASYFRSPWSKLTPLQQAVVASYMGNKIRDWSRDARIAGQYWMPESIANIEKIIEQERLKETRPVTDLQRFEVMNRGVAANDVTEPIKIGAPTAMSCRELFK